MSILDRTAVPGIKTSWDQSTFDRRNWFLTVQYIAGDRKFGETFPFKPRQSTRPIQWVEFERRCVEEFLLHLAEKE